MGCFEYTTDMELYTSCLDKQNTIKQLFQDCPTPESKYKKLIELGRLIPPLDPTIDKSALQVNGCQSIVYLRTFLKEGKVHFQAQSEALISSGLVYILIATYEGESPETILKCPPTFITELGIPGSLTPGRSNGLASIHLRIKQDALKFLTHS